MEHIELPEQDEQLTNDLVLTSLGQNCLQGLLQIWFEFDQALSKVPVVKRLENNRLSNQDYLNLLLNMRQQVIEGSRWISRCASSFDRNYSDIRSAVIKHAKDEHRDYLMLEQDYVNAGGQQADIQQAKRNIGTEALHGFLMYRASQPNPIDLIGAMWIIEGLGNKMASGWAERIDAQLTPAKLECKTVCAFMRYHADNDEEHLQELYELIDTIATSTEAIESVFRTAKVVARLYCLQLEEVDN